MWANGSRLRRNLLRRSLEQGQTVAGTIVQLPCPGIVEIIGLAGFDYILIDLEHGPYSIETASSLVCAADAVGLSSLWRVPRNSPELIMQALDVGAAGVLVPGIQNVEDARAAVAAARFWPQGHRGYCSAVRAAGYLASSEYLQAANRDTLVVLLLETRNAADQCEDITAVEGVDIVLIGPGDLSLSLGIPGQWEHPTIQAIIQRAINAARSTNKWAGIHVRNLEDALRFRTLGARLINYGIDAQVLFRAYASIRESLVPKEVTPGLLVESSSHQKSLSAVETPIGEGKNGEHAR